MNGFRGFLAGCVVLALALHLPVAGVAQETTRGLVNAVSFSPLPGDAPLRVRTLDNSATAIALREELEGALRFNGFPVTKGDTPLVLTLDSKELIGSWDDRGGALIEADRGYDETLRKDTDRYVLNIFNSRKGGLINRGEKSGRVQRTRYRLDATLADTRTGQTIWHGWAVADFAGGDRDALMKSMIPALTDTFSQSVQQQPFTVR
ncbi:MAG: hypothetical protein KIT00_02235 [Rhodospirillales bacterium]|nr:hypothetical protein [Rhodospirillales bacterium]